MNRRNIYKIGIALAVGILLAVLTDAMARQTSVWDSLGLLVDIRHQLVGGYVTEPDSDAMIQAAVRGMISSLNDPHTVYLTEAQVEQFEQMVTGTFSGIGAEIELYKDALNDTYLRIITPMEDSPAWKAGVIAGDIILEVDGQTTRNEKLIDVRTRLVGARNTDVQILVRHLSGEEQLITITRDTIQVPIIRGFRRDAHQHFDFMLDRAHGVGYIRIAQFNERTTDSLHQAINQLLEDADTPLKGLILDLRYNPGGLLESAIQVADTFLPQGQRIVSVKGRVVPERVFTSTDKTLLPQIPMVVLANEFSASASEIVTGALADNDRALFVGSRTFGKGSVQEIKMLQADQGALKLTNAYYYLPSGRNIHRRPDSEHWGVDPSPGCYVPMNPEQRKQMIEARRNSDMLGLDNGDDFADPITPTWIQTQMSDPQLASALRAVLGKLATGQWPAVGQNGADVLVKQVQLENLQRRRDALSKRLADVEKQIIQLNEQPTPDSASDAIPATQPATQPSTQPAPVEQP